VLNDVSYASGLMGRMAFSYCPFLFSPFGMGSISTGFGLFRRKISHPRLEPSWTEPTINYGMSVSAAAFTPAMGPMQKLIPGARLIFNLAGANMGDLLAIRPQTLFNTMTIWVLRLLAAIIFIADFLPFQGDHPVVRNWLPAYILKQSDWMRGFVWILASLAMLCVPLCKIACLPTSENILNAKYIRMLFQSFGYVTEIVPDTTTSAPVPHASSSPALVAPSTTAAALSQEEDDVVHLSPQPIASPAPRRSTRSRSTSVAPETPKAVVKVKTKKISKAAVPAPVLTTPPIVPAPGQSTPSSGISLKSVDFIPNGVKDGSVFPRVNAPAIEITDGPYKREKARGFLPLTFADFVLLFVALLFPQAVTSRTSRYFNSWCARFRASSRSTRGTTS
jgi:hypothetical protein